MLAKPLKVPEGEVTVVEDEEVGEEAEVAEEEAEAR
jgi:hypothetical protein